MKVMKIAVLTVEEAKDELIALWAGVLKDNAEEFLREGRIKTVPAIGLMDAKQIADQFSEMGLGDHHLDDDIDCVAIQVGTDDLDIVNRNAAGGG